MSLNISETEPDVVLIGAGIMSATLGAMLKQLQPDWSIQIYERLDEVAAESSDAWNNAGTGHAALCELNYTPQLPDGTVEHNKAIGINESFELSKQFWMYLLKKDFIPSPSQFINPVPHMSFVWGAENVTYLKKRFDALTSHYFFNGMEYSEDPEVIAKWAPLIMEGRDRSEKIAATKIDTGTDVNFGALTRMLIKYLGTAGVPLNLGYNVNDITRTADNRWKVTMTTDTGSKKTVTTKFIFIGAGGGALHLLQKTGIPEAKGFGGFPVGGQWLRCTNEAIISRHNAKVYGKASVGAPPMSVPHLDSRVIDGKKSLLFGPYAGFSTKFLKKGSYMDLLTSINLGNIGPMLAVGRDNMDLTKYLISEVLKSPAGKLKSLQEYFPEAKQEDWKIEIAGQRVQVIKKDEKKGGILQFGTEVVTAADGSVSALLGASPGASTTVAIMLTLIKKCFPDKVGGAWQGKLKEMIPSYGQSLAKDKALYEKLNTEANLILGIVKSKSEVTA